MVLKAFPFKALQINGRLCIGIRFPLRDFFPRESQTLCAATHISLARLCYHKDDCSSCRLQG
jgi:hypothetical protein